MLFFLPTLIENMLAIVSYQICNFLFQMVLGYPTSVVEGVGDKFISTRKNLIS